MTKSKLMKYPKEYLFELLWQAGYLRDTTRKYTKKWIVSNYYDELSELIEEEELNS